RGCGVGHDGSPLSRGRQSLNGSGYFSGLLHWRTERRSTTRSSTATSARTSDEAALLSGNGQPLYRAQERTRRREPGDRGGPRGRPRCKGRGRRVRYRPRLPQARSLEDRDHCAAASDGGGGTGQHDLEAASEYPPATTTVSYPRKQGSSIPAATV